MPKQEKSALVFFVPGIMGSTLRRSGSGEFGQPVHDEVWSANLFLNADILATRPEVIGVPDARPEKVIHSMKLGPKSIPVYGKLASFCTNSDRGLGLTQEENYFEFPYDWRQDNLQTAKELASFILSKDESESQKIRIIAHSMGGMIVRIMLLSEPGIANRAEIVFQIASPIQGSSKAYYTLKERPSIHKLFDPIWTAHHHKHPTLRSRLLNTLRSFKSLYQLLPPDGVKILMSRSGKQYSALDKEVWPNGFPEYIQSAIRVHKLLSQPLDVKVRCVYSNQHRTDMLYLVDEYFNIIATRKDIKLGGDGTVVASSAFANSAIDDRHLIKENPCEHSSICGNANVLQLLKENFDNE